MAGERGEVRKKKGKKARESTAEESGKKSRK